MSPGDVVLINFPFDDAHHYKQRPVLVLVELADASDRDVIVLQVTGSAARIQNPMKGDILTNDPAFKKPSVIRCRKPFSLRASYVIKPLGAVAPAVLAQARTEFRTIVGL